MALVNPKQLFPLFITEKLEATRAFYTEKAGFTVVFDLDSYLAVRYGTGENAPELCFARPGGFPDGKVWPLFPGEGVMVSVPTENADEKHAQLRAAGVQPEDDPTDKPWGWRSFLVKDPNGVVLDFFHVYRDNPLPATDAKS